ncbi:hypothetical protein AB0K05_12370 [Nonomuraea sp. NPDC049486]|uniref:hypothetical protein n=1 Tax=Nonomuraea sp. NPDC049486 TaxID=3155773 RepID=UPI0034461FCB
MNRSFVSSILHLVRFAGAALAIWGIAYVINGATQAGGYVTVRVATAPDAGPSPLSGVRLPDGVVLRGELPLGVWGATVAEQVLSRADVLLGGLCAGLAALLLSSTMKGRPFTRRDTAGLVALAIVMSLGSLLPIVAAATVLDRAGLTQDFVPSTTLSWVPIAGAGLLLALALAFHAGARTDPRSSALTR